MIYNLIVAFICLILFFVFGALDKCFWKYWQLLFWSIFNFAVFFILMS